MFKCLLDAKRVTCVVVLCHGSTATLSSRVSEARDARPPDELIVPSAPAFCRDQPSPACSCPKIHHQIRSVLLILRRDNVCGLQDEARTWLCKAEEQCAVQEGEERRRCDERESSPQQQQPSGPTTPTNTDHRRTTAALSPKDVFRSFISARNPTTTSLSRPNMCAAIHSSIGAIGFACTLSSRLCFGS